MTDLERATARETLQRYFAADYQPVTLSREDHLLAWLWQEGFRVVPHEEAAEEQYAKGFRRGEIQMRKRAARHCTDVIAGCTGRHMAGAIRALPLTAEEPA